MGRRDLRWIQAIALEDIAARGLGMDPAELRRRNFVPVVLGFIATTIVAIILL